MNKALCIYKCDNRRFSSFGSILAVVMQTSSYIGNLQRLWRSKQRRWGERSWRALPRTPINASWLLVKHRWLPWESERLFSYFSPVCWGHPIYSKELQDIIFIYLCRCQCYISFPSFILGLFFQDAEQYLYLCEYIRKHKPPRTPAIVANVRNMRYFFFFCGRKF